MRQMILQDDFAEVNPIGDDGEDMEFAKKLFGGKKETVRDIINTDKYGLKNQNDSDREMLNA